MPHSNAVPAVTTPVTEKGPETVWNVWAMFGDANGIGCTEPNAVDCEGIRASAEVTGVATKNEVPIWNAETGPQVMTVPFADVTGTR